MEETSQPITLQRVSACLAARVPLYRVRAPRYQTAMLAQLKSVWNPEHRTVLDLGGGTGLMAQAMLELFPLDAVTSIDIADRFLPGLDITTGVYDGRTLPFQDASFDCVVINNVLHHAPPQGRELLMRECRRVAGPIYMKDHIAATPLDHWRLLALDLMGNLPFAGMVQAWYLDRAQWRRLADAGGYSLSFCPEGLYRAGLMASLFPNRLEAVMRFIPLDQTPASRSELRI